MTMPKASLTCGADDMDQTSVMSVGAWIIAALPLFAAGWVMWTRNKIDRANEERHADAKDRSMENAREIDRVEKKMLEKDSENLKYFASKQELKEAVDGVNANIHNMDTNMSSRLDRIEEKLDNKK